MNAVLLVAHLVHAAPAIDFLQLPEIGIFQVQGRGHHEFFEKFHDVLQQRAAVALGGRQEHRLRVFLAGQGNRGFVPHQVNFIEHQQPGHREGADRFQHLLRGGHVGFEPLVADIHHVQQQVRVPHHLQRGAKGGHQLVGQTLQEPDRIGQQDPRPVLPHQHPRGGVERGEQAVFHSRRGGGEAVHQRGFPGIGVAHQAHQEAVGAALFLRGALPCDMAQLFFQPGDALADQGAVNVNLLLAGTLRAADSALFPVQVRPHPHQAGQHVFQLRQFHLVAGLVGAGVLAENLQDELVAVHGHHTQRPLQVFPLGRRQVVVENHQLCPGDF